MVKGIFVTETNCKDPTREVEFNAWYSWTHLPDVLTTPGFIKASRYEITEPSEGKGKFLTIYEIEADDIDEAVNDLYNSTLPRVRAEGQHTGLVALVGRDNYRQISSSLSKVNKGGAQDMAKWIHIAYTNCNDAARETEFNEWYSKTHIADGLETPGFIRATRYENTKPSEERGKFLAIYEIETNDLTETMKAFSDQKARERAEGRMRDDLLTVAARGSGNYRQISSCLSK